MTRPPGEIADLVTRLRDSGDTVLSARLLKAAAERHTVEDIAALALALRENERAAAGPRTPPTPSPALPFPASALPPVAMPAAEPDLRVRMLRPRRGSAFQSDPPP